MWIWWKHTLALLCFRLGQALCEQWTLVLFGIPLTIMVDTRARVKAADQKRGVSEEYRRMEVYGELLKCYPTTPRRILSLALELAVQDLPTEPRR